MEWEEEVSHGTHVWEREEKLAVKAKRQITQSQKEKQKQVLTFQWEELAVPAKTWPLFTS